MTSTHDIKHLCLTSNVISEDEVFQMYHGEHIPYTEREILLSHERLRAELSGAERLLDLGAAKIARLEAKTSKLIQRLAECYRERHADPE